MDLSRTIAGIDNFVGEGYVAKSRESSIGEDGMNPGPGPAALKAEIRNARTRLGISSDEALAEKADVSPNTLANWFSGRRVPRSRQLAKVAAALGVPFSQLEGAYEGRQTEPVGLAEAIMALVGELEWLRLGREVLEERLRALEAAVALQTPQDASGLPEQSVPHGSTE